MGAGYGFVISVQDRVRRLEPRDEGRLERTVCCSCIGRNRIPDGCKFPEFGRLGILSKGADRDDGMETL